MSQGPIAAALDALFEVVDDPTHVVRPYTVSRAVALHVGVRWSPAFARQVRDVLDSRGVQRIVARQPLWRGLRPRSLAPSESLRRARLLRRWVKRDRNWGARAIRGA